MVSFDSCKGNPGAYQFMMDAYMGKGMDIAFRAERAFNRVINAGIEGAALYILWNDCCGRDTEHAVDVMLNHDIDEIKRCIKGEHGRGIIIPRAIEFKIGDYIEGVETVGEDNHERPIKGWIVRIYSDNFEVVADDEYEGNRANLVKKSTARKLPTQKPMPF